MTDRRGANPLSAASADVLPAAMNTPPGGWPTVSIIMPTNSRPEFVLHSLAAIPKQDYPSDRLREVVIVDDSPREFRTTSLAPGAQRRNGHTVFYIWLSRPFSIGKKPCFKSENGLNLPQEIRLFWHSGLGLQLFARRSFARVSKASDGASASHTIARNRPCS